MFTQQEHFHFMGIGGIGMSGIATILLQRGYKVSGCDTNINQQTVADLYAQGARIAGNHNSLCCTDQSITILVYIQSYATAIAEYHQEYCAAQARGCIVLSRAQLLAYLLHNSKSICVSGSHGKTTTTAMIGHILLHDQQNPTIVVGGYVPSLGNNTHFGKGNLFVVEADESDRSLLELPTTIGIVTNIDFEHLETYANLSDIQQTYQKFLHKCGPNGTAIINADDPHSTFLRNTLTTVPQSTFGIEQPADFYATNIQLNKDFSTALIHQAKNSITADLKIFLPGIYNIYNALAAIAACAQLNVSLEKSIAALKTFVTVNQRFTFVGKSGNTEIFDDYGHHPTEINHVLQVARNKSDGPLTVVFQPHRYTRTQLLWNDFIATFIKNPIDLLVITDIYAAFESPIEGVSSTALVNAIKAQKPSFAVYYIPYQSNFIDIKAFLAPTIGQQGLLLLLGAGRMTLLAKDLI